MDVELAKTFLEIVSTRSFAKAAERLNVAQTTVSARVRLLEEQLGRPLFVRNKSGAALTPAGTQFLRYAPGFVQLWQRARQQIALPEGHKALLTIGSEVSLWQPLLLNWLIWLRRRQPDVALGVHVDVPQDLIARVADGTIDAAIMYAPQQLPGVAIDFLTEEKLILVRGSEARGDEEQIYVDWGPALRLHHDNRLASGSAPISISLGPLAHSYLLVNGGSAYLRASVVAPQIESGELIAVDGAPELSYPVYVAHSAHSDWAILEPALTGLKELVRGGSP